MERKNQKVQGAGRPSNLAAGLRAEKRERRCKRASAGLISIGMAQTEAQIHAAYQLVYQRYLKEGYQSPTPGKLRFVAHCLLPSTYTFVAEVNGRVIATLSLVADSSLGLPLEKEYRREIAALRAEGSVLAEVSCLATRRMGDRPVLMRLVRTMYAVARYTLGITDCCIAVHPRQRRFYERALLFETIGGEKTYSACGKAPAVAMRLDLHNSESRMAEVHCRGMVGRFFLEEIDYARMAAEVSQCMDNAVLARHAFTKQQLLRLAISAEEQRHLNVAYAKCFTRMKLSRSHPRLAVGA